MSEVNLSPKEVVRMNKIAVLLSAACLVGGLSAAAIADESSGHTAGGSKSQPGAGMSNKDFKGKQTFTGTITKIDHKKGTLTMKTDKGNVELRFPPTARKG
jgi:hypothetical protein